MSRRRRTEFDFEDLSCVGSRARKGKKEVQGWRYHRDRTVARRRIPGYP